MRKDPRAPGANSCDGRPTVHVYTLSHGCAHEDAEDAEPALCLLLKSRKHKTNNLESSSFPHGLVIAAGFTCAYVINSVQDNMIIYDSDFLKPPPCLILLSFR